MTDAARPLGELSAEALEKLQRRREWAEAGIGRLLVRLESALGRAWVTGSRENASDASMKRDWDKADNARDELVKALMEMQVQISALRRALKPFADHVEDGYFAAGNGEHWITVGDCKRARAALAASEPKALDGEEQQP